MFPGFEELFLVVTSVSFRQVGQTEDRQCKEPFHITIVADGDPSPKLKALNEERIKRGYGLA